MESYCPVCKIKIREPLPSFCNQCGWDLKHDMAIEEQHPTEPITTKFIVNDKESKTASNNFPVLFSKEQVVDDKYRVIDMISHLSGEGHVYLCENLANKRKAALKLYHPTYSPKAKVVRKLMSIRHEKIINVIDYGYLQDQFYEVSEFAEGGTLLQRLNVMPFSEQELISNVIPEVLKGLKFCHDNGIIHRDIKPTNIFYRDREKKDIALGDFGIATVVDHDISLKTGALTLDFAAPELFGWKGKHYVGKEADYYALGITLLYLYLGKSPFKGLSAYQIMTKHASERIILSDNLSDSFRKLVAGLLIKERKERWGAFEIEGWLNGKGVSIHE